MKFSDLSNKSEKGCSKGEKPASLRPKFANFEGNRKGKKPPFGAQMVT
jgi:hypothetical protein